MVEKYSFNPLQFPLMWEKPIRLVEKNNAHDILIYIFYILSSLRPTISVELGTQEADSYFTLCQTVDFLKLNAKCYAVGQWDSNYFQSIKSYNRVQYHQFSNLLNMPNEEALEIFHEKSIDFLHIKGNQEIDLIETIQSWSPKLSNKAIILFSDIQEESNLNQIEHYDFPSLGVKLVVIGSDIPIELQSFLQDQSNYKRNEEIFKFIANLTITPDTDIECSIIIPQYGRAELTINCIAMLYQHIMPHHKCEIIVVDDCSPDDSKQKVQNALGKAAIVVSNHENGGFSVSCNNGVAIARGKYVVFLNNDVSFDRDWLNPMLQSVKETSLGIIGAKLVYTNGYVQHAGLHFINDGIAPVDIRHLHEGISKDAPQVQKSCIVPAVMGACMLIEKDLYWNVGGFDEGYKMSYEDVDLCLKVRSAGKGIWYEARAELTHFVSQTRKDMLNGPWDHANLQRLNQKWVDKVSINIQLVENGSEEENREPIVVYISEWEDLFDFYRLFKTCLYVMRKGDQILIKQCDMPGVKEFNESIIKNNPEYILLHTEKNNFEVGNFDKKVIWVKNPNITSFELSVKLKYITKFSSNNNINIISDTL